MAGKQIRIMYVELKSGHGDSGPARITRVTFSKSGQSVYFRGKRLQKSGGQGIQGNYFDAETGDEYWVSGPKRDGTDRHWAGGGIVQIDEDVADEYWRDIRECAPPKNPLVLK
jgi:hypothetical protein